MRVPLFFCRARELVLQSEIVDVSPRKQRPKSRPSRLTSGTFLLPPPPPLLPMEQTQTMSFDLSNIFGESPDSASVHSSSERERKPTRSQSQLTEMLVDSLMAMALPSSSEVGAEALQGRVSAGKTRPTLSVPLMSKNFLQLNARLSVPFELVDSIIAFFSWSKPALTLTVLVMYTHLVLNPLTLLSIPFFFILIKIMAPAYASTHKPESQSVLGKQNPVLADGPPLQPVELPHPAPEFSKEFLLNLTDLQNHMALYTTAWDYIAHGLSKFAYYTNEPISVAWYLGILLLGLLTLQFGGLLVQFIPFKLMLLVSGWGFTMVFHPYCYDTVLHAVYSEDTRYYLLNKTNRFEKVCDDLFVYHELQEQREVEIFEVHEFHKELKEWRLKTFTDVDYTVLTRPTSASGTLSKSQVQPPKDWSFTSQEWQIDLSPDLWVKSHGVGSVVRIDTETKWVYDSVRRENHFQPQFRRRRWTRSVAREKINASVVKQ